MSGIDYGEPTTPGWYLVEIGGISQPRKFVAMGDGKLYCRDVAMANGEPVRFGPRIPEDWGECWDLGRAQELRRQAEVTCASRTAERDQALAELAAIKRQASAEVAFSGPSKTAADIAETLDGLKSIGARFRADALWCHDDPLRHAAPEPWAHTGPDAPMFAARPEMAWSGRVGEQVRKFAVRNAQQSADERQLPVRCEVEVDVNGVTSSVMLGLVHPGEPCQHCGSGYRRNSQGVALEPGEEFACTCCDGRGFIGGGLRSG